MAETQSAVPSSGGGVMGFFVGIATAIADPLGVSPQAVSSTGAYAPAHLSTYSFDVVLRIPGFFLF
jgi:hypothetical protein